MPGKRTVTPEKVLQTAIAIADTQGYAAVTLASVAGALNIRVPSLYNHVAGLPGLQQAMTRWGLQQMGDQLRRAAVGKAGEDAIRSLALAYRAFAHAHPGIYPLTQDAAHFDQPEVALAAGEVVQVVLAVLQPYGAGEEERLHIVRALRSVLHGFIALEISGGFALSLDQDESFRRLIDLFIRGLHSQYPASA